MAGWTVVLDVGKSLSKATLWDESGALRARRTRQNRLIQRAGRVVLDVDGIEQWLSSSLAEFAVQGPIDAIVPVAHGAGAAFIRNGKLQCQPLDYEWGGVGVDRLTYDRQRESFATTGSPALPAGLNLGVQLHWLEAHEIEAFRGTVIVPWAQYWGWVLSGVVAAEVSSLGCHTDLWCPYKRTPSKLAESRGWVDRFAPLLNAHDVLGPIKQSWVKRTGLSSRVEILCGLHDSNAALLAARARPETHGKASAVLSTGTWFVAMRTDPQGIAALPEGRDCLVNVDINANPISSARFMGGREIGLMCGHPPEATKDLNNNVDQIESTIQTICDGDMILPTVVPGVGPFPRSRFRRIDKGDGSVPRSAMPQLYAAMVADFSIDLIGGCESLIIEGRFAQMPAFTRALATLRPHTQVWTSHADDGVAQGALGLLNRAAPAASLQAVELLDVDVTSYRRAWREAAEFNEQLR